jgi:DNA-binding transcriptional LysR family regulator
MLADNIYHLVGSPAYLSKHGRPRMVADLADHKALLYRRPQGVVQWQAKTGDTWGELTMQAAYTTNLGDILLEEACLGGGLALIPEWCAREQIKDGILEKVDLEDAQLFISRRTTSGIYLLCHRPKYSLSKIQLCVGFLLSELPDFQSGQQT